MRTAMKKAMDGRELTGPAWEWKGREQAMSSVGHTMAWSMRRL